MKYVLLAILSVFFGFLFLHPGTTFAIENPLSLPNNKIGVHILFPQELNLASNLINSSGGDWGYVVIPIQAGDRDVVKWQEFMDSAKQNHVIPIIRLATEGDYFDTKVWRKPTFEDVLDFANFLNSLDWPVKNRYVVIFNEVNRSDEWEGNLNSQEYAEILKYAFETFKSLNQDFFIISSGLDNAAPNIPGQYMNEYDYMVAMDTAVPGIFGMIDGLGSHAYPNPGFKQMPNVLTNQSIYSFNYEKSLAYRLSGKNLPVFITETGWSKDVLSESQIASCFKYALSNAWMDKDIVVVTSFLLQAGRGSFSQFSLVDNDGKHSRIFTALQEISKTKGEPTINRETMLYPNALFKDLPAKSFPKNIQYKSLSLKKTNAALGFFKWLLKLSV